jgi:hypothetical protein
VGFDEGKRTPARTPEREPQKKPEPRAEQGPLDRRVQELKEQAGQNRFPQMPRRHYERKQATDLPKEREERHVRSRHHLQPDTAGLRLHREEKTLLGEAGRFRVISVKDAARAIYAGDERALRSDLRFLESKDLVSIDIVNTRRDGRSRSVELIEVITLNLVPIGLLEKHHFIKTSPDRRIKLPLMIGCGNDKPLPPEFIDLDQERVDDQPQLTI